MRLSKIILYCSLFLGTAVTYAQQDLGYSHLNYLDRSDLRNITPQMLAQNNYSTAVYLDTLILDRQTLSNLNKGLPKHIAIIANKVIVLGSVTLDISGNKSATTEMDKSGGTVTLVADELYFDNQGAMEINLGGAWKDANLLTHDPIGNGGYFSLACNHIYFGPAQKASFMAMMTDMNRGMISQDFNDGVVITADQKQQLINDINDLFPNSQTGDSLKLDLNIRTHFSDNLRDIRLAALIKRTNEHIQGDVKEFLYSGGGGNIHASINKGWEKTTDHSGGRMGSDKRYKNIEDAMANSFDIKIFYSRFTKMMLDDILYKINQVLNSDIDEFTKETTLFKLFRKASKIHLYHVDDSYLANINSTITSINQLRSSNILPLNVQTVNGPLEESVSVINENGMNNYFVLPNTILLDEFKVDKPYAGYIYFNQQAGNKYEIYFSAHLTASEYSKNISKRFALRSGGTFSGIFNKLTISKDLIFPDDGIDLSNSYIKFSNNSIKAKIVFKDLASQAIDFPILITSGLPITIPWQYSDDPRFSGNINLILKLNRFSQPEVVVNNNTQLINNSRFSSKINYFILGNSFNQTTLTLHPGETKEIDQIIPNNQVTVSIPNDAVEFDISHVNNPFFLLRENTLFSQLTIKNNLPVKNGAQLKLVNLRLKTDGAAPISVLLRPFEDRDMTFPISNSSHMMEITGEAIYSDNSSYQLKQIETAGGIIMIDENSLNN